MCRKRGARETETEGKVQAVEKYGGKSGVDGITDGIDSTTSRGGGGGRRTGEV